MREIESKLIEIEKKSKSVTYYFAIIFFIVSVITICLLKVNYERRAQQETLNKEVEKKEQQLEFLKNNKLKLDSLSMIISNMDIVPLSDTITEYDYQIQELKILTRKIDSILVYDNSSKFKIRYYNYNVNPRTKNNIVKVLSSEGYDVQAYPDWKEKPSFFANQPTVFYYSKKTSVEASKIASILLEKLDIKFEVTGGAGYGISDDDRSDTFLIHYLEPSTRKKE